MNDEQLALLSTLVGTGLLTLAEGKKVTKENVIEALKAVVASEATLKEANSNLKTEKETLEGEVATLKAKVEGNESFIELGKTFISDYRNEVTEVYKKVFGDKADENIVTLISTANVPQLKSLKAGYDEKLEAMFPMQCKDCGSKNLDRGSASTDNGEGEGNDNEEKQDFGNIMDNIVANKNKGTLFKSENDK